MGVPESLLHLTEEDVRQTLTVAEAVELADKGIRADAAGQVAGDKLYMTVGDAGFIKPFSGYLAGEKLAFVKTSSFFHGNPERYRRPAAWPSSVISRRSWWKRRLWKQENWRRIRVRRSAFWPKLRSPYRPAQIG
jgi:hypothetical protein